MENFGSHFHLLFRNMARYLHGYRAIGLKNGEKTQATGSVVTDQPLETQGVAG